MKIKIQVCFIDKFSAIANIGLRSYGLQRLYKVAVNFDLNYSIIFCNSICFQKHSE
jgi:hypothetical protein